MQHLNEFCLDVLADYEHILPKVRAPGIDSPSNSNRHPVDVRKEEKERQQQHFRQITQTSNPSRPKQQYQDKEERYLKLGYD